MGLAGNARTYAPWSSASVSGVLRNDAAVAVTVDLDGGHPADLAVVPMFEGIPADPLVG